MFWLILGEENDIYPLIATLSVIALDPHPPNVNLTLTVQWVGMDGFPKVCFTLSSIKLSPGFLCSAVFVC